MPDRLVPSPDIRYCDVSLCLFSLTLNVITYLNNSPKVRIEHDNSTRFSITIPTFLSPPSHHLQLPPAVETPPVDTTAAATTTTAATVPATTVVPPPPPRIQKIKGFSPKTETEKDTAQLIESDDDEDDGHDFL